MPGYKRQHIYIPEDRLHLIERLKKIGEDRKRSLGFMVLEAVEKYLKDVDDE